ncbi:MAG: hypothetical protein KIS66_01695 [Fimbriimonadaceae bacterium]|nr:hypothetical protein [Fimbriimonadaceae bacterium]
MADAFVTFDAIKTDPTVSALIDGANSVMSAMGYTEHGHRHAGVVSKRTGDVLRATNASLREVELGMIAAYTHDIGNAVNRVEHAQIGASIMFSILDRKGMDPVETAAILGAIGNHEESVGSVVSAISAALILADKSDVHYTRVQNPTLETFDIHDRVNYATRSSKLHTSENPRVLELRLEIDTGFASVMEYFETFLSRMVMCRKAADFLGYRFSIKVNGTILE